MKKINFLKNILWLAISMSVLYATPMRIMPLGDSITYDDRLSDYEGTARPTSMRTGYRSHLYYKLSDAKYEVDFVGSLIAGQSIAPAFDPNNEGHPGWTSYDISHNVYNFLLYNPADIVLLHIGSNDGSTSVDGVNSILDEIDLYEEHTGRFVRVIVALIIDGKYQDSIYLQVFNQKLSKLLDYRILNGDALTVVDMYRGAGLTSEDYADGSHPNDAGYQKMADVWFDALMSPYNFALHSFPSTLVNRSYIHSISVDEAANTVVFVTGIPDSGIIF